MNMALIELAQRAYDEEIAAGTPPEDAAFIANGILVSATYRAAWLAGRPERLREREEREETYCACLTGCETCGGVPNHGP